MKHFWVITTLSLSLICNAALAQPWANPDDIQLRHDLQLLKDAGVIKSPIMAWPIPWGDIAQYLPSSGYDSQLPKMQREAMQRVFYRFRDESRTNRINEFARFSIGKRTPISGFGERHQEEATATLGLDWVGERFAFRLSGNAVSDASDDKTYRWDGSFLGMALGNWMVSAGAVDHHWGPGWDGSLILSSNARPLPMLSIERNAAKPFESKWLSWMGPWRLQFMLGQFESDRVIEDALFMGMRVSMQPTSKLEIGLSRTAQWGGEGRPTDLGTLGNLLIGRDNVEDDGIDTENEPGNQLAGFDVRWSSPFVGNYPYAIYAQMIGEDEAGGLPSRYIGLFGAELWGAITDEYSYRVFLEYVNTTAAFYESEEYPSAAYNHSTYKTGYRYYGRTLGHSIETAGELSTLGILVATSSGHLWKGTLRTGEVNGHNSASHVLSPNSREDYKEFSLAYKRPVKYGQLGLELQVIDAAFYDEDTDYSGRVEWRLPW